eukprot:9473445-Pyramimonas_sp.AAC.1
MQIALFLVTTIGMTIRSSGTAPFSTKRGAPSSRPPKTSRTSPREMTSPPAFGQEECYQLSSP